MTRRNARPFALVLLLLVATGAAPARHARDDPAGTWRGNAVFAGSTLEFSVRVVSEGGVARASISCPDLMLLDQPLDGVRAGAGRLRFATHDEHPLVFDGVVGRDSIRGSATLPAVAGVVAADDGTPRARFALGRAPAAAAPPYATRELHVAGHAARLAATLFMPAGGAAPRAGVVLLQGSTSNLRREVRFFADHFARAGFAVLVFDKRGNGGSTGDYAAATYDVLADDAAAAVDCLRQQRGVDSTRVGVWGHGQGAFIAPLVAARVPSLGFIVAVSAPGIPVGEGAAFQDSLRLLAAGFDAADVTRAVSIQWRLHEWLRSGRDEAELGALLVESAAAPWRRASSLPAHLPAGAAREGWNGRGRTLDPAPWWRDARVPVLAVYGAADELVPARPSARAVERALRRGRNPDVTVKVFPAANHVLRTPSPVAGPWDWPRAAAGYMELVTGWMIAHTAAASPAPPR